jgi:hypothetical protein
MDRMTDGRLRDSINFLNTVKENLQKEIAKSVKEGIWDYEITVIHSAVCNINQAISDLLTIKEY